MASSLPNVSRVAESPADRVQSGGPERWNTILLSLALALIIVAGAWFVGGRQGFDQIGTGGQNLRLLPRIGDPAPDFAAPTVEGQLVQLSDLRGRPVWLNFWGS